MHWNRQSCRSAFLVLGRTPDVHSVKMEGFIGLTVPGGSVHGKLAPSSNMAAGHGRGKLLSPEWGKCQRRMGPGVDPEVRSLWPWRHALKWVVVIPFRSTKAEEVPTQAQPR